MIGGGAEEEATGFENQGYGNRGSDDVDSGVDEGSVAAGDEPLMEFVGEGIEGDGAEAPEGLPGTPAKELLFCETAIDEKGQDRVLGDVGELAQESVEDVERPGGDADVERGERVGQQKLREVGTESFRGHVENERSPGHGCDAHDDATLR